MARLGAGQPNRPIVLKNFTPYTKGTPNYQTVTRQPDRRYKAVRPTLVIRPNSTFATTSAQPIIRTAPPSPRFRRPPPATICRSNPASFAQVANRQPIVCTSSPIRARRRPPPATIVRSNPATFATVPNPQPLLRTSQPAHAFRRPPTATLCRNPMVPPPVVVSTEGKAYASATAARATATRMDTGRVGVSVSRPTVNIKD